MLLLLLPDSWKPLPAALLAAAAVADAGHVLLRHSCLMPLTRSSGDSMVVRPGH